MRRVDHQTRRGPILSAPAIADRVIEHVPRAGLAQLVAALEDIRRRASVTGHSPTELMVVLRLNEKTGVVIDVEVRKRYGWFDI